MVFLGEIASVEESLAFGADACPPRPFTTARLAFRARRRTHWPQRSPSTTPLLEGAKMSARARRSSGPGPICIGHKPLIRAKQKGHPARPERRPGAALLATDELVAEVNQAGPVGQSIAPVRHRAPSVPRSALAQPHDTQTPCSGMPAAHRRRQKGPDCIATRSAGGAGTDGDTNGAVQVRRLRTVLCQKQLWEQVVWLRRSADPSRT